MRENDPELPSTTAPAADLPGHIGPYRIIGLLGEGGMGVVYAAEQESPRRRVAVKVVRGGQRVAPDRLRMFQREVDTLARLEHPGIARIYESGRTEEGQPYFAMELVEGEPLGAWAARRGPVTTREELHLRLALFLRIVHAVHHAHQRGVIHRDLKPANLLVQDEPEPSKADPTTSAHRGALRAPQVKVLDFGLARIVAEPGSDAGTLTEVGVIKGSLPYLAPEQARGRSDGVDVRTDVHALGAILFELISSRLPYEVRVDSPLEALRILCEVPPADLRRATRGLRLDHDLPAIVGKALEKDPRRRYASCDALAEDVQRYLASEPILARPAGLGYQLGKFAARNKALVGGAAATALALTVGTVVSVRFAVREAAQRRISESARSDLEAVTEFQADMLSGLDPHELGRQLMSDLAGLVAAARLAEGASRAEADASAADLTAILEGINPTNAAVALIDSEVLARGSRAIDLQFGDQPLIAARLRISIGRTYAALGLYAPAEEQLRQAVDLRRASLGVQASATLDAEALLSDLLLRRGRHAEAEALAVHVLEARRRLLGDAHADTVSAMGQLAVIYDSTERLDEAERLLAETLVACRQMLGEEHPDTLAARNNLALHYVREGRLDEARDMHEQTLKVRRRMLGEDHPDTLRSANNLANVFAAQGRHAEAERLDRETLARRQRVLGADHPDALASLYNLAMDLVALGRPIEAEPLLREVLARQRLRSGPTSPDTNLARRNLLVLLRSLPDAHGLAELELENFEALRAVAVTDEASAGDLNECAWQLLYFELAERRDPARALELARRACDLEERAGGTELWNYLDTLAHALKANGDLPGAAAAERRALELLPAEDPRARPLELWLAQLETGAG